MHFQDYWFIFLSDFQDYLDLYMYIYIGYLRFSRAFKNNSDLKILESSWNSRDSVVVVEYNLGDLELLDILKDSFGGCQV